MRYRAALFFLVLVFCSGMRAQQRPTPLEPLKVGIISLQQAISSTKEGQQASQDLTSRAAPKEKDFSIRQQEITQLEQQLNRSGVLSDEKKSQLATEIDDKKRRLERDTQDAEEDMRNQQQTILQHMGERLMTVIRQYAKENGYTLILETGNPGTPVVFAAESEDITKAIVTLYDRAYPLTGTRVAARKP